MKKVIITASLIISGLVPGLAHAQTSADPYAGRSEVWWGHLAEQLTKQLDVRTSRIQSGTLQNIIYFATHYGHEMNLDPAVPHLLRIYRAHGAEEYRMMAAAALHAIGDQYGMAGLEQAVDESGPSRARRVALAALVDYYSKEAQSLR